MVAHESPILWVLSTSVTAQCLHEGSWMCCQHSAWRLALWKLTCHPGARPDCWPALQDFGVWEGQNWAWGREDQARAGGGAVGGLYRQIISPPPRCSAGLPWVRTNVLIAKWDFLDYDFPPFLDVIVRECRDDPHGCPEALRPIAYLELLETSPGLLQAGDPLDWPLQASECPSGASRR